MTVKVEVIEGGVPHTKILVAGLILSIVCIYLTYLDVYANTQIFAFFGGLGAIAALIWGSHTVKVLASYGIGTGVPSTGYVAFGAGVVAMLFGTRFGILAPIVTVILAAIIGVIIGFLANNVLQMKIPVMIRSIVELSIIGSLILLGLASMMTGSFTFAALSSSTITMLGVPLPSFAISFIGGSLIAVAFLLGMIGMQHPFNACLGPGWKQDRMLMLSAECGFLTMIVAAVISAALIAVPAAVLAFVIALIGLWYSYTEFIALSKRDAAAWLDSKPIPEMEGE
jgi:tetrahydromethanopterin S-methyltransferase subunit C